MKTDWNKITEEAFSSDEVHTFSESYCRRRAELQRGVIMEKKRIKEKRSRFNAGIAATAAAFLLVPVGTVAALHLSHGSNVDKMPAALSESSEAVTENTEPATVVTVPADDENAVVTTEASVFEIVTETTEDVEIEKDDAETEINETKDTKYRLNFDNVPDTFISDGFKYHLNDGQYHAGGITPDGPMKYNDLNELDKIIDEAFNKDSYSSERVDEYMIGDENDPDNAKKVYLSYRVVEDEPIYDENNVDISEQFKKNGWFDRDAVVVFGDTGYAAHFYVHSDVSNEQMMEFINGVTLEEYDPESETE